MLTRIFLIGLAGLLSASAQTAPRDNYSLFRPTAYAIEKQMDAVLALTPEQESKVADAVSAWEGDADVEAKKAESKALEGQDTPDAITAKQAYEMAQREAEDRYRAALDEILTGDQKQIIEAVNTWANAINEEVKEGDGGWNERMVRFREEGRGRLGEVLSPAQIALLNGS